MRQPRLMMLLGACLVGVLTMTTAHVSLPPGLRLVLGILIVFLVPGFALVTAVLPDRQLSRSERLLASIGLSVVTTVCAAVALAAAPIGLSRQSIGVALGLVTLLSLPLPPTGSTGAGINGRPAAGRGNGPKAESTPIPDRRRSSGPEAVPGWRGYSPLRLARPSGVECSPDWSVISVKHQGAATPWPWGRTGHLGATTKRTGDPS